VTEQQDPAVDRAEPFDHPVGACADVG
jgi:hypothetical protein